MNPNSSTRVPGQVLLGLGVISVGILFLLDNLGFVDARMTLRFWPLLLILFGVLKLTQARALPGYLVGGGLVLLGVLLTANRLGFFVHGLHTWWPIVLVLVGGLVIVKALQTRSEATAAGLPEAEQDSVINAVALLGGFRRRIRARPFRGGEITAIMGGCDLDLRDADIDGEAVLQVFAMWGAIDLKVPAGWTVIVEGTPIMGGFDEKTVAPAQPGKRLIVRGYAIMGGVEISN